MLGGKKILNFSKFDRYIMVSVGLLLVIGMLMVYSASNAFSRDQNGDSLHYFKRQLLWVGLGITLMFCAMIPNYEMYESFAWLLIGISVTLLVLVYIPKVGAKINGSRRWIKIGTLTFQPVELAKLAIVIYIARFLNRKADCIRTFQRGILPVLVIVALFIGLIGLQPDFGSVVLIVILTFLLLFAGGARIRHLLAINLVGIAFIIAGVIGAHYRLTRIMTFLDPWSDPKGRGYHTVQSYLALGSGGICGTGIGGGIQKLHYLPTPHTDSIFSVIGEELGFIGTAIVIILYMIIVWRGVVIAKNAGDRFASSLALGISCLIGFQALINIGVATGSLPPKGITLPFISFGGSSLVICLISIGILLNISRDREIGV